MQNPDFSSLAGQQGVRTERPPHPALVGGAGLPGEQAATGRGGTAAKAGVGPGVGLGGQRLGALQALRAGGACDRGRGDRVPALEYVPMRL